MVSFIAKRIRFNKGEKKQVSPPAIRLAIIGMALGLAVMILSVAIVIGFKREVSEKVIGFGSHIQITNYDSNASYEMHPIAVNDSLLSDIRTIPGIRHVALFATKPGIIKTDEDFQGIVLKGVDENYDWDFFRQNMQEGTVLNIQPDEISTDIVISRYLADKLQLKNGDSFLTYFVQDDIKARKFRIAGIYQTNFAEFDQLFVLSDIKQIKRLNQWDNDMVSGVEILTGDFDHLDAMQEKVSDVCEYRHDRLGNTYYVRSIKQLNPMIFSWLDLLDMNVVIILILMLAVAGFTMISSLLIIILERTNMIGILKAMGAGNTAIRKIFLRVSLSLVLKGLLWGNVIGISICLVQKYFSIFKLDPEVYYLSCVPVELSIRNLVLLNLGTLAVTMLMLVAPSYIIARISPAKTIRFE
ncbi:MAG: ABC transporter permease [Dysgonamonadaceae bacterium]|jgi:lipoprotein-releasing system permease protein|nr:ABC transporter permease [Dysgonamonadaceae bacterium]